VHARVISQLPAKRLNAVRKIFKYSLAPQILHSKQQLTKRYMRDYLISNRVLLRMIIIDGSQRVHLNSQTYNIATLALRGSK